LGANRTDDNLSEVVAYRAGEAWTCRLDTEWIGVCRQAEASDVEG
jgi:hypothetical protein